MNMIKKHQIKNKLITKIGMKDSVLFVLIILFGVHLIMDHKSKEVVSFDLNGASQLFMHEVAGAKLSSNQQAALSKRFASTLKHTLEHYASTHHVVILVKGAVIAGTDITPAIEQQVAEAMEVHYG